MENNEIGTQLCHFLALGSSASYLPSLCLGCVSQNGTRDTLKTQHGRPHGLMVAMCSSRKSELYLRNTINI